MTITCGVERNETPSGGGIRSLVPSFRPDLHGLPECMVKHFGEEFAVQIHFDPSDIPGLRIDAVQLTCLGLRPDLPFVGLAKARNVLGDLFLDRFSRKPLVDTPIFAVSHKLVPRVASDLCRARIQHVLNIQYSER